MKTFVAPEIHRYTSDIGSPRRTSYRFADSGYGHTHIWYLHSTTRLRITDMFLSFNGRTDDIAEVRMEGVLYADWLPSDCQEVHAHESDIRLINLVKLFPVLAYMNITVDTPTLRVKVRDGSGVPSPKLYITTSMCIHSPLEQVIASKNYLAQYKWYIPVLYSDVTNKRIKYKYKSSGSYAEVLAPKVIDKDGSARNTSVLEYTDTTCTIL